MLMNYPSKHLLLRRKGKLLEHSNSLKGFRNILTVAVVSQRRCLPVESLQFSMRMEMLLLVICTMRGARRCGVPVSWRKHWARCSRLGIADMCLMSKVANWLFENEKAVYSYLATCSGHLWKYDITADEVTLVSSDIPFDENDLYI